MRRRTIEGVAVCLALCATGWLVALVNAEDESDERVSWEQLPAAIRKNLAEHAADVTEIEKGIENGKVVSFIEFLDTSLAAKALAGK